MNTRDCPGGEEVSIKQISYPVYNKTTKHFYSQILIVLFFAHRRMKSVQMEKAMCVLTLIAIKYVQKPTNWSCTCWHTRERDLTRYVMWATDSLEQSHSMRSNLSLSLSFFFQENLPYFTKCLESVCHYDSLPLLIFEALLWGRLRVRTLIFCLFNFCFTPKLNSIKF